MDIENTNLIGASTKGLSIPEKESLPSDTRKNLLILQNKKFKHVDSNNKWREAPDRVFPIPIGQHVWTTPGVYQWVVPKHVTEISFVAVGGGQAGARGPTGGTGGDLVWRNNVSVTPGEILTIFVGAGGVFDLQKSTGQAGQSSYIRITSGILIRAPGGNNTDSRLPFSVNGGKGGKGGGGSSTLGGGGGGAGGYEGDGGLGGYFGRNGRDGQGGAAGGGSGFNPGESDSSTALKNGSSGGDVGLMGLGVNGLGGETGVGLTFSQKANSAKGGNGSPSSVTVGGGGGAMLASSYSGLHGSGTDGGVRIIYGEGRAYPSSNTRNM